MRGRWKAGLSFGLLALAAARADAGAWIASEGGQAIQTEVVGARDETPFLESQLYLEAPLGPRVSLVARPWIENGQDVGEEGWRAEVEGGVKAALWRTPSAAVAVQASAVWRSDPDRGCAEGAGEVRALGGVSFAEGRGFVNAETAARVHDGGCPAGRIDLTFGYRPAPRWLGMAETFVFAPEGREADVKAQLSLVRFGESGAGVQVGVRFRVDGDEPEPALVRVLGPAAGLGAAPSPFVLTKVSHTLPLSPVGPWAGAGARLDLRCGAPHTGRSNVGTATTCQG